MTEPTLSFPRLSARTRRFTLGDPRGISIAAGGRRILFLRSMSGTDPRTGLWVADLPDGHERLVADPSALGDEGDLPAAERARRERAREQASGVVAFAADAAGRVAAFALGGVLWVADVDAGTNRSLPTPGEVFDPRPDPTGRHVAYTSGNALRLVAVDGTGDRLLAGEDAGTVSWGRAEFVAAEDMDRRRGFWWAPDGSAVLAARVDEAPVQVWWIGDPTHPDRAPTPVRYPSAGTANADVSLHLLRLDGARTEVRWDRTAFPYLGRVTWSPDGPPLLAVQDRDQRTVRVLAVDVASGSTQVLHEDVDPTWVEFHAGTPAWYGDRVVRIADVDGARRLFVGAEAVTPRELYVRSVAGSGRWGVVFTASADDPTQVHVYRWSDRGVEPLTTQVGVHGAVADADTVVLSSSTLDDVGSRHTVVAATGTCTLRSLVADAPFVPNVRLLRLGPRDVAAGLLLPREHMAGTRIPVLVSSYAGPGVQRVLASRRAWLEAQWFADQGFAVLVVDGRGTPGRDPAWERQIRPDMADVVLTDQVDALHAAAEVEPALDLTRVGIRGWSFGGYLAALAVLRRPEVFHAAVAGAPVTDWALYDTFYTERYLGHPAAEPDVYRRNSLLADAPSLRRPLMLVHGLADDNVVAAHTLLLSKELTEHGRPHVVLPLPGVTHMTPQESVAENLLLLQVDFLRRALG